MTGATDKGLGRILVTGGTGQVGQALVSALLRAGHSVAVLTRSRDRVQGLWPDRRVEPRRGDLTEPHGLVPVLDGIETLFHLASYAPGPDEPDLYNAPGHWRTTAEGTANLMALAADSTVERVLYLSSIKVMGEQAGTGGRPADETRVAAPDTLYGRAKLVAERSVLETGRTAGVKTTILRLPMVYGLKESGNISRMFAAVAAGRFPPWPRIHNRRSAVHVEDAVAAAILAARAPGSAGETYFVTDGRTYSTRWLYEEMLRALGRPIPGWNVPLWALRAAAVGGTIAERLTDRRMPLALDGLVKLTGDAWYSSEKLEQRLGFIPRRSLATEIRGLAQRTPA